MEHFITKYDVNCPAGTMSAALEDSIMHKGRPVTAGSKILENFVSPLDATVVTKLEAAGITILGKTKMDEFGASGLFGNMEPGAPDSEFRSGAVSAVAEGDATFALCNDYTGAVSQEAAAHNLCYIHPTYGSVSRYGLIHAVPSMDQIGIVCKTPADGLYALSVISGHDPKDGAMFSGSGKWKVESGKLTMSSGRVRVGVPVNVLAWVSDASAVLEFAKGFDTVDFDLGYFDVYAQVMQILCSAELSNNTTRYDGIKFGYRAEGYRNLHELYTKSRTEAFGADVKLASIIGSMVLSQENYLRYYDKAMRIRRLIKESLEFDKYDVIIMPTAKQGDAKQGDGSSAWLHQADEPSPCLAASLCFSALPRLCGLPAVTVPFKGGGITLIGDSNCENVLFSALEAVGL